MPQETFEEVFFHVIAFAFLNQIGKMEHFK